MEGVGSMNLEQLILTLVEILLWGGLIFLSIFGIWYRKKHIASKQQEEVCPKKHHV